MGFAAAESWTTGSIEQLQEKVIIIREPVALPAEGFNLVVDSLKLARRDGKGSMGDDPIKMVEEQSAEPPKIRIFCFKTEVRDLGNFCSH